MRKDLKQYAIAGVIALVVASVAGGGAALAGARQRVPQIKTAIVTGPVALPASDGVIASLSLPAGKWAVSARADLLRGSSGLYAFCTLKLGGTEVDGYAEIASPQIYDQMTIMVSGTTAVPTPAQLICNDISGPSDIDAQNIVITAIKAGKLSVTQS